MRVLNRFSECLFQFSAAGNLHAYNGNCLNLIQVENLLKFFTVINPIEFGTADQRNVPLDKVMMKVRIGIGTAVCRNQQTAVLVIWCLKRCELDLYRPLAQDGTGNSLSGLSLLNRLYSRTDFGAVLLMK